MNDFYDDDFDDFFPNDDFPIRKLKEVGLYKNKDADEICGNKRIYKNCTVTYDEEYGSVDIKNEKFSKFFDIKTADDREKIKDHDTNMATIHLLSFYLGATTPLFFWGCYGYIGEFMSNLSLQGVIFFIVVEIISTLFFGLLVGSAMAVIVQQFGLDQAYRKKRIRAFLLAALIIFILVLIYANRPATID